MNCLNCNAETNNPSYCPSSCAATRNNKLKPKRKLGMYCCKTCATPVGSGYTYCKECFKGKVKDLTLEEAIYSKHHKSSAFALVRTRARSVVGERERVCKRCGYTKHVEVCHIKPISSFPLNTLLSTVNHPDNLILLCPNCHWEFDHLK